MGAEEFAFLESMDSDRSFTCGNIDTSWHNEEDAKLRREKKQRRNQYSSIDFVFTDHEISAMETEEIGISKLRKVKMNVVSPTKVIRKARKSGRELVYSMILVLHHLQITRRLYSSTPNIHHTCNHIEHVRSSMNSVHGAIYETFAELDGHNFSYYESQLAITIVHHHSFNVSVPLKVGCTAPMFVLSFFLHSILFAGSALDSFQCLRSLLIVSFHVFFGLPRPRCPTTSNSVMLLIQPSFLTTCPNQRSRLYRNKVCMLFIPSFLRRESELMWSFNRTLHVHRTIARS